MPKRTNDFQKLGLLIEQQLASRGMIVRESQLLRDHRTGHEREIDILIETQSSVHPVTIGIECIDHTRRASVTWVEQIHAKHADVPVNKTILISRSGFAKAALLKAKLFNMETISLSTALTYKWVQIVHRLESCRFFICFRNPVEIKVSFDAPVPPDLDRSRLTFYTPTGEALGDPREFLDNKVFNNPSFQEIENNLANFSVSRMQTEIAFPAGTYSLDSAGSRYNVHSWTVTVTVTKTLEHVPLARAPYTEGAALAHGKVKAFGVPVQIVFVEQKDKNLISCTISFSNESKSLSGRKRRENSV